jgi:hypothetical protein
MTPIIEKLPNGNYFIIDRIITEMNPKTNKINKVKCGMECTPSAFSLYKHFNSVK